MLIYSASSLKPAYAGSLTFGKLANLVRINYLALLVAETTPRVLLFGSGGWWYGPCACDDGQGVQDFVKEPVLGLLKSVEDLAPEELMAGMARGAGSLLKHSVGGVANSVSLITGRSSTRHAVEVTSVLIMLEDEFHSITQ